MTHSFLQQLADDILTYENEWWPRSKQVETGASQVFRCRAETVLRLNGAAADGTSRVRWQAEVGSAVDGRLGDIRKKVRPSTQPQLRVNYRGVPATVDEYDEATKTLTDWKTKDDAAHIANVIRYGVSKEHRAQIHLGAAGLIEAGYEVETVQLCYLPRAGQLTDGYVFSEPFDRALADEAAEWVDHTNKLAADRAGLPWAEQADGLRDQLPSWCHTYCDLAPLCRGPLVPTETDEFTRETARQYLEAKDNEDAAHARAEGLRELLKPYDEVVLDDGVGVRWSGGKPKDYEDTERMVAEWKELFGKPPTRPGFTSRTLRKIGRAK